MRIRIFLICNVVYLFCFFLFGCSSSGVGSGEGNTILEKCYKAGIYLNKEDYIESLRLYTELLDKPQLCDNARQNYLYICSKLDKKSALKSYKYYLKIFPHDTAALDDIAYAYLDEHEYDSALVYYKKAIKIPNISNRIKKNYRFTCLKLDKSNSVSGFKYYLGIFPNDPDAIKELAYTYISKNEYDSSLIYYKKLIQLPDIASEARQNYLYACSKMNFNGSVKSLKYYIGVFPKDTIALKDLAFAYLEKNEYDSSLVYYKELLKIPHIGENSKQNYLFACSKLNKKDEMKNLKYYLEVNPGDYSILEKIAYSYLKENEYDSSYIYYKKLNTINFNNEKDREIIKNNYHYVSKYVSIEKIEFSTDNSNKYHSYIETKNNSYIDKYLLKMNYYRKICNLDPVKLDRNLCRAAEAHAVYLSRNVQTGHTESKNMTGFTGEHPWDRAKAFGCTSPAVSENIDFGHGYENSVDQLISTVYHRFPFIDVETKIIGIGIKENICVIDYGMEGNPDDAHTCICVVYPAPNQCDLPIGFEREIPNPMPGDTIAAGLPVTLQFTSAKKITVDAYSYRMKESQENEVCWLILPETDLNKHLDKAIAVIPKNKLRANTEYTFYIKGKIDNLPFEKEWNFKTK